MNGRDSADDAMSFCALRFDGWKYVERRGDPRILSKLSMKFVETLQASSDSAENHAAFFALQRYLHKWGGEQLAEDARERKAYKFLFLHLYLAEVDPDLRDMRFWERWRDTYAEQAETFAAEIRARLLCGDETM